MTFRFLLIPAIFPFFILGCENGTDDLIQADYSKGIYVVNEGSFGGNNGSISYADPNTGIIINGIFAAANDNRPLGDVVQSMSVVNDTMGYIVVNGSSKVEIVDLRTFKTILQPVPVFYPRYFLQVDQQKGYLTSGSMQGKVYVIDLGTGIKTDSIDVGNGPETMLLSGQKVLVANSGGWLVDSTISIVDIITDKVLDTIATGKVPADMSFDSDNNLWVICKGYARYNNVFPYELLSETDALVQKINPETKQVLWEGIIGKASDYASFPKLAMSRDGLTVFYLRPNGIYKISASDPHVPVSPMITGSYYGFDVNPSDGNVYVFEASFDGAGSMSVYDETGLFIMEGIVGIGPSGAVFNIE
jgi:hypothetical protein